MASTDKSDSSSSYGIFEEEKESDSDSKLWTEVSLDLVLSDFNVLTEKPELPG